MYRIWPAPRKYSTPDVEISFDDEIQMIKNTLLVLKLRYDKMYNDYLDFLEYSVESDLADLRKELMLNTENRSELIEYYKNKMNNI